MSEAACSRGIAPQRAVAAGAGLQRTRIPGVARGAGAWRGLDQGRPSPRLQSQAREDLLDQWLFQDRRDQLQFVRKPPATNDS